MGLALAVLCAVTVTGAVTAEPAAAAALIIAVPTPPDPRDDEGSPAGSPGRIGDRNPVERREPGTARPLPNAAIPDSAVPDSAVPSGPVPSSPVPSSPVPSSTAPASPATRGSLPNEAVDRPAQDAGKATSAGSGWTGLAVATAALLVLAALVLAVWRRRRPAAVPSPAPFGDDPAVPALVPVPPAPSLRQAEPLRHALGDVAAAAPGGAIAQQIGRLLAADPGRDALVTAAVRFRDQLADRYPALAGLLLDALRRCGVVELRADGEGFDAARHEAVGTVAAPRPEHHDRIAETVRPGYADADRVLRLPQVVVGRYGGPPEVPASEEDQ